MFVKNKETFEVLLKKYFSFPNHTNSVEPLKEVFDSVKREDFRIVLDFFRESEEISRNFGQYIRNLFEKKPFNIALTEANILSENGFFPELRKRILNSVLPPAEDEKSVSFIVNSLSVRLGKDLKYLQKIPDEEMSELFHLLGINDFILKKSVRKELLFSANILAWRAIGNALDTEVMNMLPEYKNYDNPFLALQDEMDLMKAEFSKNADFQVTSKDEQYRQIKIYLRQCLEFVDQAFKNASKYGISFKINQSLLKIKQQIIRISDIMELLVIDKEEEVVFKSKKLVFNILSYKSHKNNVAELVNDSTRLMSHLITNHTAETGAHYISSTRKEYLKMFWKSSGGGVIVGFLCVLKMLYGYIPGSDFSHAFMYSFNYAMGFIMIYLMNYTLATKQPAMTAATMAKVLSEEKNTKQNYEAFANLVSKLFRTQFIAFIGNVLWAFPVALLIIYGVDVLFNHNFATDKATKLLEDLDPFQSKAFLHASIAGFFLFVSGIVAGNIGNHSIYYSIPRRIEKNPLLIHIIGKKTAKSISLYYAKNWAGIMSNFWFGVCLGVTAPIGAFLGLDLDIRHITFSAGNFALGLYGKDFSVDSTTFWISFVTVFLIGFFNFIVSFGLSIMLAMRSRKINLGGVKGILKEIFRYFIKNPLRFILPIGSSMYDSKSREMMETTTANKSEGR